MKPGKKRDTEREMKYQRFIAERCTCHHARAIHGRGIEQQLGGGAKVVYGQCFYVDRNGACDCKLFRVSAEL